MINVTLRVRVWIETALNSPDRPRRGVTLRVRVWIETSFGLLQKHVIKVTLRVRVWIETPKSVVLLKTNNGHPPREGVD